MELDPDKMDKNSILYKAIDAHQKGATSGAGAMFLLLGKAIIVMIIVLIVALVGWGAWSLTRWIMAQM